jgi:hypothetical protein
VQRSLAGHAAAVQACAGRVHNCHDVLVIGRMLQQGRRVKHDASCNLWSWLNLGMLRNTVMILWCCVMP